MGGQLSNVVVEVAKVSVIANHEEHKYNRTQIRNHSFQLVKICIIQACHCIHHSILTSCQSLIL